jgi:hypothetical protein
MENSKKTLVTISKVCYVISYVLMILAYIACGLCLVGIIVGAFIPYSKIVDYVNAHPEISPTTDWLSYANVTYVEVACLSGLLSTGVGATIILFARNLFKGIRDENTPFSSNSVHNLNLIGILSLVQALGLPIIMSIVIAATKTGASFNAWNSSNIIFALFIFALSLVFKYGVYLQHESDTTL